MNLVKSDSIIPDEVLINKIYLIRDQKVMLDRDLADLYGVEARRLREQVKRNATNFPLNFMFQLSVEEVHRMVSQNAIPSKQSLGGSLPFVFTEHGVLMLANVLRSEQAIRVSIKIIDIFVKLRAVIIDNSELRQAIIKLEDITKNSSSNIKLIFEYLEKLAEKPNTIQKRNTIGYTFTKK